MNKKLTKEKRDLVEKTKTAILNHADQQDEIFNKLIKDLNIENETDVDWIFDFIYNAGTISDAYYKMIEDTIFEQK